MGKNLQLTLSLEVTVPRLVLPIVDFPDHQAQETTAISAEDTEQIHLSVPDGADSFHPTHELQPLSSTVTPHESGTGAFRLFLLKYVIPPGNRLLMKLLRHHSPGTSRASRPTASEFFVTDQISFLLDIRQHDIPEAKKTIEVLPGLKRITIVLNDEHIPHNYYIDGAEN